MVMHGHFHADNQHDADGGQDHDHQGTFVNSIPDEVCIVVEVGTDAGPVNVYDAVLRDLGESERASRFSLLPKYVGSTETRSPAMVQLPPSPNHPTTDALLFYKFASRPDSPELAPPLEPGTVVREINEMIDRTALRPSAPYTLQTATQNWFHDAADDHSQGCPGTRPEPADSGDWWFKVPESLGPQPTMDDPSREVHVAVLDTSPERETLVSAATSLDNPFIRELIQGPNPIEIPAARSLDPAEAIYVNPQNKLPSVENWHLPFHPASSTDLSDLRVEDHGFFVAGIIRRIAPQAKVHVIRVLGAYGTGDMHALARVLGVLLEEQLQNPERRLIINMSLVAAVPEAESRSPGVYAAIERTIAKLTDLERVLVVASAGNQDKGHVPPQRPVEASFPARLENVLGVASLNREQQKSWFSSRARAGSEVNGVAIFGGDGDRDHHPLIKIDTDGEIDGVVSVFSATGRPLPLNTLTNSKVNSPDRTNRTGWAYWAGTSFATPAVSALAANVWAANPAWSGMHVRQRLLEVAAADSADKEYLGGGRITITQHLR